MRAGILFIVVGPSGAGKDTLMDGARQHLAHDQRFHFARRTITRSVDAGGENHQASSETEFLARKKAGEFLVTWQAHGLSYGLPATVGDMLSQGQHVIANGSRAALAELQRLVPRMVVLRIIAPLDILAQRLLARGRENSNDVNARLARADMGVNAAFECIDVINDGSAEEGILRFIQALERRSHWLFTKPLPIDSGRDHIVYLPADSHVGAEDYAGPGRIEISAGQNVIYGHVNIIDAGTLLAPEEIGLSKEGFRALGLPAGTEVAIARTPPQKSRDALQLKVRGGELSENQYETVLNDIVRGRYPESEIAAFLVAATRALTDNEVISLARVRTRFTPTIQWNEPIVVDKHSMGGIPGSRITLIVAPIVAAHGLAMPKTSSRAITSAAGTADAMEVLARVDLNGDELQSVVAHARACIAWNGRLNHSPLDDVMNAITRSLGLDSNRWSVASIISKKITAGSSHIIVDIPYGARTKLVSKGDADDLGRLFELVGRGAGLTIEAHATDGSGPIGRGIGPALEVRDVFRVLENRPEAPRDLREKALTFAARILAWDPAITTFDNGRLRAEALLTSGAARMAFDKIITAQGRRPHPASPASLTRIVSARHNGIVTHIDGWCIAGIARRAGAPLDKGAGIDLFCGVGDMVLDKQPLFAIHANDVNDLEAAYSMALNANGILTDIEDRTPRLHAARH
ncbi:MAG: phosphonate metabolism protein/1,5-bisphosphokinase (PRPP-forming) PhnN [Beijerinckiaceae bacterium]